MLKLENYLNAMTWKIRLKNAALKTISQAKERSILFMKNNLQNVQQMQLNIDIQPSYMIIPENGSLEK